MTPVNRFPFARIGALVKRRAPTDAVRAFSLGLDQVESWTGKLRPDTDTQGPRIGHPFEPGDVLFGKLRPYLAKVWASDRPGAYIGDFLCLIPRFDTNSRFVAYVLRTQDFIDRVTANSYGSKMPRIEWDQFKRLTVPTPNPPTQRRIVDYLDHETAEIDTFIRDAENLSSLAMERRAASLERALVLGTGRALPLRRLSPVQMSGVSVNAAPWPSGPGEPGVLKTGAVSKGWFDPMENKAVLEATEKDRLQTPIVGDRVLVNRANTPSLVGSAVYVPEAHPGLYLSDKLWSMNFSANNEFMALTLSTRHYREQVKQLVVGASSSMQNLSYRDFLTLSVQVPSITEQARIVEEFTSQSRNDLELVAQAQKARSLASERRAALISAAVAGQLDVTKRHKPVAERLEDEVLQNV